MRYDVAVRPTTKTLSLDPDRVPYSYNEHLTKKILLYTNEDLYLPAFCETLVDTTSNKEFKKMGLASNWSALTDRFSVCVGQGLI
jgi:hypothetical protein